MKSILFFTYLCALIVCNLATTSAITAIPTYNTEQAELLVIMEIHNEGAVVDSYEGTNIPQKDLPVLVHPTLYYYPDYNTHNWNTRSNEYTRKVLPSGPWYNGFANFKSSKGDSTITHQVSMPVLYYSLIPGNKNKFHVEFVSTYKGAGSGYAILVQDYN